MDRYGVAVPRRARAWKVSRGWGRLVDEPTPDLHEDIITNAIDAYLDEIDSEFVERRAVDPAEVADRVALHLARLIDRSMGARPGL